MKAYTLDLHESRHQHISSYILPFYHPTDMCARTRHYINRDSHGEHQEVRNRLLDWDSMYLLVCMRSSASLQDGWDMCDTSSSLPEPDVFANVDCTCKPPETLWAFGCSHLRLLFAPADTRLGPWTVQGCKETAIRRLW